MATCYDRFFSSCFSYQIHCAGSSLLPPHALSTLLHSALCYKRLHTMTYITWLCCPNFSLCSANGERRQDGKGIYSPGCHPKGPTWTTKKFISFDGYFHLAWHITPPSLFLLRFRGSKSTSVSNLDN